MSDGIRLLEDSISKQVRTAITLLPFGIAES